MELKIRVNGDHDKAKGTPVISVQEHLTKGKYDDYLTWPFSGTIIVAILNHLEDKDHYKQIITFRADNKASQRVLGETSGSGWGKSEFIPHTELDYNTDKKCQYLKDDTLVFRVSVDIPNHKPWLDCTALPNDYIKQDFCGSLWLT